MHTITLQIQSKMTETEIEEWILDAIQTDLQDHLLDGEKITLVEVR